LRGKIMGKSRNKGKGKERDVEGGRYRDIPDTEQEDEDREEVNRWEMEEQQVLHFFLPWCIR
jgi:hypothetical protein